MLELIEWALVRVTLDSGTEWICATGMRRNHPWEGSSLVVTSRVKSVSDDRSQMITENSVYQLSKELPDAPPKDHRCLHILALYFRGKKQIVPDRFEWLRPDGSVSVAVERAEIEGILKAEMAARSAKPT
jgi:hypothetical protein